LASTSRIRVLLDDMFFADGGLVPSDRFIGTRVEAELAFVMKRRLAGPAAPCSTCSTRRLRGAGAGNSRYQDRAGRPRNQTTRKIFDTIADNAANAGIVLGGRPCARSMRTCAVIGALCYRNGQLEETGLAAGAESSRHCGSLARQTSRAKRACAGSGSGGAGRIVHSPDRDRKGDTIQADYGPYGTVSCYSRLMDPESVAGVIDMPHFTLEYSGNLDARVDMGKVVEVVRKAAVETGIFRSAAFGSAPSAASTSPSPTSADFGFLDMVLRLRRPRPGPPAGRRRAYLQGSPSYLDPVFAASQFALSFDMQINDKETSWNATNIHDALKAEAAHG